ncbi:hypothetical protein P691DRAFT_655384 [Macrolepiota fuliginosa MF-IS2]|uniref:F-box domain-containing protein n=1 Tax=Macrolepiota fuliginosa MF-IS2 TaxID=1400762 RepID=A0A9P6C7F3_9AGAR|nr:hypothetical protein P691DRAFT_655384 [Macrolepiota fuliginosa MF-IS2]
MSDHDNFKRRLTQDLINKLAPLLKERPELSTLDAMGKISKEMLENNPFAPPEGNKCPINMLPDELLTCIFEMGMFIELEAKIFGGSEYEYETDTSDESCEDEDEDEDENAEDDDSDNTGDLDNEESEDDGTDCLPEAEPPFQVLVSHVCKRWRTMALATPSLWVHLDFQKGASLDKHRAFVERAKSAPLEITIDCTSDTGMDLDEEEKEDLDKELMDCLQRTIDRSDSSLPVIFGDPNWHTRPGLDGAPPLRDPLEDYHYSILELSDILDLLVPRVKHWRALSVSADNYRWMYLLLARLHQCGPAENLEVMELYVHDDDDTGETFQPRHLATRFTPFRGQAPRLRGVSFWGVHLDWDASLPILKNLESLELAYHMEEVRPSYQTLETILKSPEIKELTLCLSGPKGAEDDWQNASVAPIQIPTLKHLALRYHSPECACSLLRYLDTPNTTSLTLDFDEKDYNSLARALCMAPHGRSKSLLAGLEEFKVSGLPCRSHWVDRMLEQLANVKHLILNCMGEGELFFDVLLKASANSGAGSSSGKIYCPVLETITTSGISGKQMKSLIEAREKAGVPISRVFMSEKDVDRSSVRWLKDHVKEFDYFEPSDSEEEVFEVDDMEDIEMDDFEEEEEDDDDDDDDDYP